MSLLTDESLDEEPDVDGEEHQQVEDVLPGRKTTAHTVAPLFTTFSVCVFRAPVLLQEVGQPVPPLLPPVLVDLLRRVVHGERLHSAMSMSDKKKTARIR